MNFNIDIFEPELAFSIEEANQEVDGKHVLAKVRGNFFVPDGVSRNNRFYPRALWERVVSDPNVKKRLAEKRMYGTIGHDTPLNDDSLREGKFSHIVTSLAIEGSKGVGEALILDTPAGRILNTVLRAKSKMFVSSRATGDFKGEMNGVPVVNMETFGLNTFDFVMEPGFLAANPTLAEDYNNLINLKQGEDVMSEKLLETLAKENASYKIDLERVIRENETLKNSVTTLSDENNQFKAKVESLESASTKLAEQEAFFKENGSAKEVTEALKKAHALLESNFKFFEKFGSKKQIAEAFNKSCATVKAYQSFGSVKELEECFSKMEKESKKMHEAKVASKIESLAKELSVSEEAIKTVYGKITESDIRKLFPKVQESARHTNTFRKTEPTKVEENKVEEPIFKKKTLGESLMASYSK